MKRLFDCTIALLVLFFAAPVLLFAVVGILVTSPGPVFYKAARTGQYGEIFYMLKFRSMHNVKNGPVITANNDPRIFGFGKFLRKSKIDELPQFWNVLVGDMSVIGPRPEDPKIVNQNYNNWMKETLNVRPGISSPGAIYYYGYGESLVSDDDPEGSYVEKLLPPKLAVELAYLQRANFFADIGVVYQTLVAVTKVIFGGQINLPRRDLEGALQWVNEDQLRWTK
jgi:lipopolysaccharide/colanic/teichoic acid biosynthesis glycosyltransferase